jgi:hypothetical protein
MSVSEREKKDLAKGKKSGQRGENVTLANYNYNFTRSCWFSDYSDYIFRAS